MKIVYCITYVLKIRSHFIQICVNSQLIQKGPERMKDNMALALPKILSKTKLDKFCIIASILEL